MSFWSEIGKGAGDIIEGIGGAIISLIGQARKLPPRQRAEVEGAAARLKHEHAKAGGGRNALSAKRVRQASADLEKMSARNGINARAHFQKGG